MKTAVTGASGYLGRSYISMYEDSCEFVALSRNTESAELANCAEHRECDYSIESLKKALVGCDAVVHLAYAMATKENEERGAESYRSSEIATENLLSVCLELGIENITVASSRMVYPNYSETAFKEDSVTAPGTYYGKSKLKTEQVCKKYVDEYGAKIKVLRFGQIIGPNMKVRGLFSVFAERALEGEDLTLIGNNIRDYIYIYDACRAIDCAVKSADCSGIYNISMGVGTDNRDMAEAFISATGSKSRIVEESSSMQAAGDRVILDCSKAREVLGFNCKYDTIEVIAEDYFKRIGSSI